MGATWLKSSGELLQIVQKITRDKWHKILFQFVMSDFYFSE